MDKEASLLGREKILLGSLQKIWFFIDALNNKKDKTIEDYTILCEDIKKIIDDGIKKRSSFYNAPGLANEKDPLKPELDNFVKGKIVRPYK